METAHTHKTDPAKKSVRRATQTHTHGMATSRTDSGAVSGMPMFLQQQTVNAGLEQQQDIQPTNEEQLKNAAPNTDDDTVQMSVQMWDCGEYDEPTCVQKQTDETAPAVQEKCTDCEKEEKTSDEPDALSSDDDDAVQMSVQMWDCGEYDEPTCVQEQTDEIAPAVQEKCTDCEKEEENVQTQSAPSKLPSPRVIRREAARGLKGAHQDLPHKERIQTAFGHHDVSAVRTLVGGSAAAASRRMGALAFTAGDRIGFRASPNLHLAAHETAHTVQQRAGLSLPNQVGQAGDRYERHADQVADAVVAGRSAEQLLDRMAAPNSPSGEEDTDHQPSTPTDKPVVQPQITSGASRLMESSPATNEESDPETASEEAVFPTSGQTGGQTGEQDEGVAEDAAVEADDAMSTESAPDPEGVPANGNVLAGGNAMTSEAPVADSSSASTPSPQGTGSSAAASAPTSTPSTTTTAPTTTAPAATAPAAPAATAPTAIESPAQGGVSASCYSTKPEDRPDNVAEPSSDERGSAPQEKPQVTFEPWPEAADDCPAQETVAEGSSQMPEGIEASAGTGSASAATDTAASGGTLATAELTSRAGSSIQGSSPGSSSAAAASALAETGDMDSQIASAEGDREVAVDAYMASTGQLNGVLARAQSLTSGVTFPAAVSLQQAEARQVAINQTQDFMGRAGNQITAAVAFAQTQVPELLSATAAATKGSIQNAIESEKGNISARIAQARTQARTGAAAARAHVNTAYANSAATIESITAEAIGQLDTTHTTSLTQVDTKETAGLDDVNSRFEKGRTQHEEKGPDYAKQAIARGQQHVEQYEKCKNGYKDDGFWDGCLTVRRARAQQDAACKTAAGYKDIFLRTANKKGYDLIALRKQYRCAVIAGAGKVNQTLDDTYDQLVSGLESGRMQALNSIAQARSQNLAAIDNALTATLQALSAQEFSQRQGVNDTGYLKQLAVEQLAHTGATGLAKGIAAAMDSLEETLVALRDRLAQGDIPDPETLAESLATTEASLGGGMGSLLDTMAVGAQQASESIATLGGTALDALDLLTAQNDELTAQAEIGFAQQIGNLKTTATNTFNQLTENHVQQAQKAMTDGTASMVKAVAGFDESLATIGGKVDTAIATSLQELDKDLAAKLGELDGQIATEAWKAAEKEQPAWKSVVAIVLIILVIIAAAVISIVTLGAGASLFAIILVGALVGAVSGGLIQLINNWASGEAWDQGLAQAMIMGAIGGALGGGLGFAGGALAAGAAAAGARVATQVAVTLTSDLVAEAATQAVGYVAFGQEFNWQGFVMAGAMSGVSFRAHPGGARAGAPRADVPAPSAAGSAAGRRAAVTQIAGGAALGLGLEYAAAKVSGQEFDLTKAASSAASGAVGARMARRGSTPGPAPEPTTRIGRAAERFRNFDPGGVGARLETGLEGLGGRTFGPRPSTDLPTNKQSQDNGSIGHPMDAPEAARPRLVDEPTPPKTDRESGGLTSASKPAQEPVAAGNRALSDTETPQPIGLRNTLEWSGTPTSKPAAGDTHLGVIQRGLDMVDRIAPPSEGQPSLRGQLAEILPRLEDPLPAQRSRLEDVTSELQTIYADPQASKLRAMPRDIVEQRMGQRAAAQRDELMPRIEALEAEATRLQNEIETARTQATEQALAEMRMLRQRLTDRNNQAENLAGKVKIDEAAVRALEAQGRSREAAIRDLTEFYGLTGARGPNPDSIQITSGGGRPEATRSGGVDIGEEASRRTIFHEMGHHIEFQNPSLAQAGKSFVEARARHSGREGELVPLQELQPRASYEPHEQALVGDFMSPYTGKVYPDMTTEVITTGLERFTTPEQMLGFYRGDPEHFFFTLGAILK